MKDDIIGISVDLADEGIEVQLKRFPAWRSLQNDLCIVMSPPKASIPFLQRMATQTLNTALKVLETVEDLSILTINCGNARIGIHILLSIGYPLNNYTPYKKGKKIKFGIKDKMVLRIQFDIRNKTVLVHSAVRKA